MIHETTTTIFGMQQLLIYFICRLSILEYNEDEQCTLRKEIFYETNIRDFREFLPKSRN